MPYIYTCMHAECKGLEDTKPAVSCPNGHPCYEVYRQDTEPKISLIVNSKPEKPKVNDSPLMDAWHGMQSVTTVVTEVKDLPPRMQKILEEWVNKLEHSEALLKDEEPELDDEFGPVTLADIIESHDILE